MYISKTKLKIFEPTGLQYFWRKICYFIFEIPIKLHNNML